MFWGIYSTDGLPGAAAFRSGLCINGHGACLRSLSDWTRDCVEREFDAVAIYGLRHKGRRIMEEYQQAGTQVFIIDYGYMRRANTVHDWLIGHWQVSPGGLNKPPAFDCPPDRLQALSIDIKDRGGDPNGYTLVCAQTPGDAAHGMSEEQIQAWCEHQRETHERVVIRPHPLRSSLTYGLPVCEAPDLQSALAGARLVVTGNSNSGHDALLAGVPTLATLPGAAWEELSGTELPSMEKRMRYFSRLAYGQWTWDEFGTGVPQKFIIERLAQ